MRLTYSCIIQLKAQGPSRTCNESKEEEEDMNVGTLLDAAAREGELSVRNVVAQVVLIPAQGGGYSYLLSLQVLEGP